MRHDRMNIRYIGAALLTILVAYGLAVAQTTQPSLADRGKVEAVVRIGMTVEDMDRSIDFYTRVLDFKKVSDVEIVGEPYEKLFGVFGMRARVVTLKLGDESIELTQYLTPRGRLIPRDSRSNDHWFQHIAIVTSDIECMYQRLRENKVRHASTGAQTLPDWNPNAGGIRAFYFHDPDDHVLEIIWFPPGKGNPRWQGQSDLLLGIDHTAIVVSDTEKSLEFYRDLLGMKVAGTSENWGTEQEHLNNVFGARLRITTLKAASGPGVEFLEYLTPRDGRAYPEDAKPNDLFHWHTIVATHDADTLLVNLASNRANVVSRESNAIARREIGFSKAFLARVPDGHAVMVAQP